MNRIVKTLTFASLINTLNDNNVCHCVTADENGIVSSFRPVTEEGEFFLTVGDETDDGEHVETFFVQENEFINIVQYESNTDGVLCARFVSVTGDEFDFYFVAPFTTL
jgi:hypothetical protein